MPTTLRTTVLVAEDDEAHRTAVSELLHGMQHIEVVAVVSGGPAAVDAILSLQPAVALLGLTQRESVAFGVLEAVRGSRTRILVFIGPGDHATAQACVLRGATGCLSKHASAMQLLRAIDHIANSR